MSCSRCVSGTVHDGETAGKEQVMHGLNVYITKPAEGTTPKGLIVFITDAFGWRFVNNRLLADKYAQNGDFLVIIPDFMNGTSLRLPCQSQLTR
jgi:dienelactone hydrolase